MEKTDIKFGTDGFRGIIAKDFTFDTVERIIKAICLYLRSLNSSKNTVIVGYDPRFMAQDFAEFCSTLLVKYGFNVVLSDKVVPTPIVAYNAKYYPNSIGAIMLTASHNPKEYQGIKFIPNYGGPADKTITDEILTYLDTEITEKSTGSIKRMSLDEDYIKHIESIIDFDIIKKNQPKIIYDGLFSSSIGYFDKILENNKINYESYNMFYSSDFGGGLPEPKSKFMKHVKKGAITIANDGDADRYGVIDENGNYVSPNIILALLLKYLVEKNKKGAVVITVGVSNIVDITAKKLNIQTIVTPVGFKWLSEVMRNSLTIIAGEDSGGLSIGGHIPEKDGLLANLLIIEMMSYYNKSLVRLQQELKQFCNCEFYTDRVDITLQNDDKVTAIMDKFLKFNKIADLNVKDILKIDGLKFILNDGYSSLLIRKSGTEPLLRFYIESNNLDQLDKIKAFVNRESL